MFLNRSGSGSGVYRRRGRHAAHVSASREPFAPGVRNQQLSARSSARNALADRWSVVFGGDVVIVLVVFDAQYPICRKIEQIRRHTLSSRMVCMCLGHKCKGLPYSFYISGLPLLLDRHNHAVSHIDDIVLERRGLKDCH